MTTSVAITPSANNSQAKAQVPREKSESFCSPTSLISRVDANTFLESFPAAFVLAELIGTAALLFFGCAGAVHWKGDPGMATPFNFGITVMAIIQTFGHISFALLNPAVNLLAVVYNLISVKVKV